MTDSKYANGKIYRLSNSVDDEIYIGSTCAKRLSDRLSKHKTEAKRTPNIRVYEHLGGVGWSNVFIELIEVYPCESKLQLETRERYFIEMLKPSLNTQVPTRTHKEYYEDNKQTILEKQRLYNIQNKGAIATRRKQYYNDNKEKFAERNRENREQKSEYNKRYYEERKETERQKKREYQAKIRAEDPEKARQKEAERHAKNKLNPEYREENRERCAKWYAKKKAENEAN